MAQIAAIASLPAFLVLPTLLHYRVGPAFVDAAVGDDFAGGMKRLFEDGPPTQEQVLHPRRFLGKDRDLPRKIVWGGERSKALGEGWTRVDEESFGELDFAFWLDRHLAGHQGRMDLAGVAQGRYVDPKSRKASEGWDGIWVEAWDPPGGKGPL